MEPQGRPLLAPLHAIPAPRQARGRRHPLAAMLACMCVAMLCGDRRDSALVEWGRCDGQRLARALGLTRDQPPCAATVHHVLRQRDGPLMEAALSAWADSVLTAFPPAAGELEAIAIDGHTVRGRRTPGALAVHLLSALRHRVGLTVWQQAVADKPPAIPVLEDVLRGLLLEGRVITGDAWLTPRAIAPSLVTGGGEDVMIVKGTQPQWPHAIRLVFQEPRARTEPLTTCDRGDHGHGRLEERRLTASLPWWSIVLGPACPGLPG